MAKPVRFRDKWRIRWMDEGGKRQSDVFDTFREAEHQLRLRETAVVEIKRGLRAPTPPDKTFDALCDYWLENRASEKRSQADDVSMIRRHLRPAFGKLPLRAITVEHIDRYKADRAVLAAKTVGNHLTLLSTMLRMAVEELHWLASAPVVRKPRVDPDDETDPPWLKTPKDIQRLLTAARAEIDPEDPYTEVPFVMYSVAVYTGLRAGELAGLRWSDVDLERRTINVRRSYDGKTKTRASRRHVPIMDVLLPTLRAWKLRCPVTTGDVAFPNSAGKMFDESARIFQEVLHRVLDRAGFERPTVGRSCACQTPTNKKWRTAVGRGLASALA